MHTIQLKRFLQSFFLSLTVLISVNSHAIIPPVEYFAGQGPNVSFLILDFNNTGGPVYSFGYCYTEPISSFDMLLEIANAGPLHITYDTFPFGHFITNFSYQEHAGNTDDFWRFELGTFDNGQLIWETSGTGIDNRTISHRSLDGFYNSFTDLTKPGFANFPQQPLPPEIAEILIPSPTSVTVTLGVFLALMMNYKKRIKH